MSEPVPQDFLSSLDRRVSEHDGKFSIVQRDFAEVSHEVKEVLNRINGGLSPSVNEVRKENSEIKLSLKDLAHKIDLDMIDMRNMVKESTEHTRLMIDNFERFRLKPVADDVNFIKKTFIYGLVGALIVFLGQKGMNVLWDRVFVGPATVATPHQSATEVGHES